jgi:branched-subunit amino acid transport protein AzlD
MKTGIGEALILTFVMGAVILLCRAFPFLFFRNKDNADDMSVFLTFVEKTVPPAAMTVLACTSLAGFIHTNIRESVPALAAAVFTALVHIWRRNPLISIFGGTALYMILERITAAA